jgi:hypothetical protein
MRTQSYLPEWLSLEVSQSLAAISGGDVAKKEATILRLAEATASGESWSAVFCLPDTCAKRRWYGTEQDPGWQSDPAIAHALALATERARWWVRVKRGRAVQNALDVLIDGSEDAAKQLINLVRVGRVIFYDGKDQEGQAVLRSLDAEVKEVLAASKEVLDRVSEMTATKQQQTHSLSNDQFNALMQQAQQKAKTLEQLAEQWQPEV